MPVECAKILRVGLFEAFKNSFTVMNVLNVASPAIPMRCSAGEIIPAIGIRIQARARLGAGRFRRKANIDLNQGGEVIVEFRCREMETTFGVVIDARAEFQAMDIRRFLNAHRG
jgi:hypothetical protein